MKSRSLISLAVTLILGLGASTPNLFAQGTDLGTIRGTVTDSSGAVVPNAQVEILDLDTRTSQNVTTNGHGDYQAAALQSGNYQVTVTAPGFGSSVVKGVRLTGSDAVGANAVLHAASNTTNVEVTSDAPLIDTTDHTLSQTLGSTAIVELPRDSRDIYSFLYINPNITQGSAPGEFKFIGAQSYGASFSVDGQRSNGGIFGSVTQSQPSLEAVGELNVMSNAFSAEYAGIANVRVTTKRGGAQYHGSIFYNNKNSALSAWSLADKDTLFNYAPTFDRPTFNKPRFNANDVGASVGGPIPKLKDTWFFTAYEHNSTIEPSSASSSTMPHPTLLTGDFSLMNDGAKPAVGSAVLTPSEIATDTVGGLGQQFIRIPQRLLNPVTTKLIDLYFPKVGASAPINPSLGTISPHYTVSVPGHDTQDMGTLRIDHNFSDSDRIYGVYQVSAQSQAINPVVGVFTGLGLTQRERKNQTVSLSYTHIFSPAIVNELRGGFNKQHLYDHSNTTLKGFLSSIGFSDADIAAYGAVVGPAELDTRGHPAVALGRFQSFSNGGRNTDRPMDQNLITFGDTLTWTLGRHSVKLGGDFVRNQAVDGFAVNRGNVRGLITYSGTGASALSRFLQGQPADTAAFVNLPRPPMSVYNWETGYFVQDDFRVTSRLTLNLGMRYEIFTPFIDKNDLLANFDPNYNDATTGQKGRFVIPSTKTLKYLDPAIVNFGYVTADQSGLGVGRGLVRTDKSGFGPRFGLAFRVTDNTVLRGGYGMYYPTSAAQGIRDPIATNPFNQGRTKRPPKFTGPNPDPPGSPQLSAWPTGGGTSGTSPISGGVVNGFGNTPSANYVPVGLKNPRVQQWNVTVERQIPWQTALRVSYIGSKQSGQVFSKDLDMIAPNDQPFGTTTGDGVTPCDPFNNGDCDFSPEDNSRIAFPALGSYVGGFGNNGHSFTTSFQTQAERRANGFTFSVAYTFLNQKSSGIDTGNSSLGGAAYNPFDSNSDYTQDSYTSRHRVVAYGIFDLPVGRGKRFLSSSSKWTDALVGGWQASTNMFVKSGTAFTPFWVCDDCYMTALPGNVASPAIDAVGDFSATSFRPIITGDYKNAPAGYQWNAAAFALPTLGSDLFSHPGVAKRNSLIGPGTYGVNLGLHKTFRVSERIGIQLGADINNLFNHPMLSPNAEDGGGGGTFASLGNFSVQVDQTTNGTPGHQPKLLPLVTDPNDDSGLFVPNKDFGKLYRSYEQEGISSNREIRLRGRITF